MIQNTEEFLQLVAETMKGNAPDGVKFETIKNASLAAFETLGMTITSLEATVQLLMREKNDMAELAGDRGKVIDELRLSRDILGEKAARLEKNLRDEFAGHALNGILSCYREFAGTKDHEDRVKNAWMYADLMLKTRP
jgi:hypothetical protein